MIINALNCVQSHILILQIIRGMTKTDKDFAKRLDFKDIEFTVETRDINKIEKKTILALAFLAIKTK